MKERKKGKRTRAVKEFKSDTTGFGAARAAGMGYTRI
jgi:hypothetical protein